VSTNHTNDFRIARALTASIARQEAVVSALTDAVVAHGYACLACSANAMPVYRETNNALYQQREAACALLERLRDALANPVARNSLTLGEMP
jgi:hypothetical protein